MCFADRGGIYVLGHKGPEVLSTTHRVVAPHPGLLSAIRVPCAVHGAWGEDLGMPINRAWQSFEPNPICPNASSLGFGG